MHGGRKAMVIIIDIDHDIKKMKSSFINTMMIVAKHASLHHAPTTMKMLCQGVKHVPPPHNPTTTKTLSQGVKQELPPLHRVEIFATIQGMMIMVVKSTTTTTMTKLEKKLLMTQDVKESTVTMMKLMQVKGAKRVNLMLTIEGTVVKIV